VITILAIPVVVLNFAGGIIGAIWLAVLGRWALIGAGFAALFASTFFLSIAVLPGALTIAPATSAAEKGKYATALFWSVLGLLWLHGVMAAWCVGSFLQILGTRHSGSLWPYLLWSYAVATGPWTYMASQEQQWGQNSPASMTAFFACLGCVAMMLITLASGFANLTDLVVAFAIPMSGCFVWQLKSLANVMKQQKASREVTESLSTRPQESAEAVSQTKVGEGKAEERGLDLKRSDTWYVFKNGKQIGPTTIEFMKRFASDGLIQEDDFVWREGLENWVRAREFPGLFRSTIPEREGSTNNRTADGASQSTKNKWNNYFARHWRGELSLPISYWVNGFFLNFAIGAIAVIAVEGVRTTYHPLKVLGIIGAIWFCFFALNCWQLVGIWRSAGRYQDQKARIKRSGAWGGLAKAAVVLGVIQSVSLFARSGVPQLTEASRIAFLNDPGIPDYALRIMRNGAEIEISGGLKYGLNADFNTLLRATPQIKVVHLNSVGGRLGEAEALAETIRAHHLITYTSGQCASACTVAFLAGRERWIGSGAKLGFHGPKFPGMDQDDLRNAVDNWKKEMLSVGISGEFVQKAVSTPNASMWYPEKKELLAAHVITGVASRDQFAASGFGSEKTRKDFYAEFLKTPLFAALERKDQTMYSALIDEFYDRYVAGEPEEKIILAMRSKLYAKLSAYIPMADDTALMDFARLFIAQAKSLASMDKRVCFRFTRGDAPLNMTEMVPESLRDEEWALYVRVLNTAEPRPKIDEESVRVVAQTLLARLEKRLGDKTSLLDLKNFSEQQQVEYCDVAIAYYEEILQLGPRDAPKWLRHALSN